VYVVYLLVMKATSVVSPKGALSGMLRNIKKKPRACVRNPVRIMGSRPYRTVFEPRIPNIAPPKKNRNQKL
jgi:hypothetical protein